MHSSQPEHNIGILLKLLKDLDNGWIHLNIPEVPSQKPPFFYTKTPNMKVPRC